MDAPRLGIQSEPQLLAHTTATPDPSCCGIYDMTCGKAGSLTHCARPGIECTTSWFLVGFGSAAPGWELHVPAFLFVGDRLHSASLTFPELKGRFKQLLIRERRGCRNKEALSRNKSVALGQDSDSSSRNTQNNIFELFCRTKASIHPGGGWQLQAEHKAAGALPCYVTTNHSEESHTLQPSPQILLIKTSPNTMAESRGFKHEPPTLLASSCNKRSSAQKKKKRPQTKNQKTHNHHNKHNQSLCVAGLEIS